MARRRKRRGIVALLEFVSCSASETQEIGKKLAKLLKPGDIVTLSGDLGAGKTTLVKGLVGELAKIHPREVASPTFTYLNIFSGTGIDIYHFDLYRLKNGEEFISMGFDEYLAKGQICCIEWPEKIDQQLPGRVNSVKIVYLSEEKRHITFKTR